LEQDLFYENKRLFDNLTDPAELQRGFKTVKANKGAPGIDGVTLKDFESRLHEELSQLSEELTSWSYKPKPAKLVEIPKPGSRDKRKLGIQCVRDRVVDATMRILMEPFIVPTFSKHSYGFIAGRNQQQAVAAGQAIVKSGKCC
jgi:retron-type reverse transcriptase